MPDPTPVPPDEIEAAVREKARMAVICLTPAELSALCEALRIAVEGLEHVEGYYLCAECPEDGTDFDTCRGSTDDPADWCGWCCALDAIEAVRELVDLGEKP